MRTRSPRLLYLLLCAYGAISMTYYVAGVAALRQEFFYGARHAEYPFKIGNDALTIAEADKAAATAGLATGDVLTTLNGRPYTGLAQLYDGLEESKPGDAAELVVREPNGQNRKISIRMERLPDSGFKLGGIIALFTPVVFVPLLSLIVGYWVVAARPLDFNAWLVLVLLTFPEIGFGNLDWHFWGGDFSTLLGVWYLVHQYLAFIALLWFGVYFPERWRVDVRWPAVKWTLTMLLILMFVIELYSAWIEYFHVTHVAALRPYEIWVSRLTNWALLLSIAMFLVSVFDKLRSASSADARRRLQVLATGSTISLVGMVIVEGVFPRFGFTAPEWLTLSVVVPLFVLFPLSLAYVVVVQRAMEVRILVRMGTKYLLAKATLIVLQIAIAAAVIFRVIVPLIERHRSQTPLILAAIVVLVVIVRLTGLYRITLIGRLHAWVDRRFFREAYNAEVVLSELSERARGFTEKEPLIEMVSRRVADVLHIQQVSVWLRGSNVFQLQQVVGIDGAGALLLPESSATIQNLERTNRPATVYRDRPDEWLQEADASERRALDEVNAELLLPLPGRERLMGVMALGPKRSEEPYTSSDVRLLQSVATQTGLALEVSALARSLAAEAAQRERVNREIEIAREVQQRLFPQRLPEIPGVSLAGLCRPALGVGGDYYDVIDLENGQIGIAIGDVSGKGISAALLMASLRASLRGMTLEGSSDLAKTMKQVNRLVYEASANNRYATFFFATYEPATRTLRYVNAGHNPPMLVRGSEDGKTAALRLEAGGVVVGLLPVTQYAEAAIELQPGDVLLTYTDGISEAMTANDEEWGEERMLKAALTARTRSAQEILEAVFQAADEFTAGADQHDDMTLLVMKLEGSGTVL